MKIVVTVKLVPDPNAEKRIDPSTKRLVRTGVETLLNPDRLDDCTPRYKNGFHAVSNFRSDHEGGAYFLFADGASHFVSEGIVPEVYRALSSIAGSESVDYIN